MNEYSYDDPKIKKLIEEIAIATANKYKKIAYYDAEDIRQEVRMKCVKSLNRYDPTRSDATLKTFLITCSHNRIRDIKRSVLYKHNNPCRKCDFQGKRKNKCNQYTSKSQCPKYKEHERFIACKLAANKPLSLDENRLFDRESENDTIKLDMIDYIYASLSPEYYEDFYLLVESNFNFKTIHIKRRGKLMDIIAGIVKEFCEE